VEALATFFTPVLALPALFTPVEALPAFFTPVLALAALFTPVEAFLHLLSKLSSLDCIADYGTIDDGRRRYAADANNPCANCKEHYN
jgi:hypothetical protein